MDQGEFGSLTRTVATLQVKFSFEGGRSTDADVYGTLLGSSEYSRSRRNNLELQIQQQVQLTLGPPFFAALEIRRGSIEFIVIITTLLTATQTIAQYPDLKRSLPILLNDIRHSIKKFIDHEATWLEIAEEKKEILINVELGNPLSTPVSDAFSILPTTNTEIGYLSSIKSSINVLTILLTVSVTINFLLAILVSVSLFSG